MICVDFATNTMPKKRKEVYEKKIGKTEKNDAPLWTLLGNGGAYLLF